METNQKIAAIFRSIADLLDYQGIAFKPAAYRKAAQVLEELQEDVSEKSKKELMDLSGIGEATAGKIREFVETGKIEFLEKLQLEVGAPVSDLMKIDDLGPKRVAQLQAMGITTADSLIKAAQEGKLRDLPRFSELLE